MFHRTSAPMVPEVVILAGVVLLVTSVFHAVLVWCAGFALTFGGLWFLVACLRSRFFNDPGPGASVPGSSEPTKEG